jgi:hypothetical protein
MKTIQQLIVENAQLREENKQLVIKCKQLVLAYNKKGNGGSVRRAEMQAAKELARTSGKCVLVAQGELHV